MKGLPRRVCAFLKAALSRKFLPLLQDSTGETATEGGAKGLSLPLSQGAAVFIAEGLDVS